MANIFDPKKPKKKVKEVILPNRLREKVGGVPGKIGAIDPEIIAKAEKKVQEISQTYADHAGTELQELQKAFSDCQQAQGADQTLHIRKINHMVHDIRGQGASFGYPLLTEFAKSLYDFTENLQSASPQHLHIIKAHIDTIQVVIAQKINGDGGDVGQQLKQTLKIAIERYSNKN